ncbi:ATP-binding protein [Brevibacillus marinus]|uniref:ATP-binding protein n=1 Tax=Brevibacillus marinus TaxID=2496837 RepID=UPI000F831406|nr:sensor histidine kinase [Brevibacillus marinus]
MKSAAKKPRISLLGQMILLIAFVLFVSIFLVSAHFATMVREMTEKYLGQQAMTVAKLAAENKAIIEGFAHDDPPEMIQPVAEHIRQISGASYVVIGNREGIRYSHYDPANIGKPMGTSNAAVFERQESVIYLGTGVSGPAVKAKTPIYDAEGNLIGVSSVGYTLDEVAARVEQYTSEIVQIALVLFVVSCGGAVLIARRVKKLIFGLEPAEISFLFKEKEATIESIRDAIVAVDLAGRVTSLNKRAREILKDLEVGKTIDSERIQTCIQEVIRSEQGKANQNIAIGHELYVMDVSPILMEDKAAGAVMTIRTVSEIEQLADEVTKIRSFAEHLRAQNHEYLNKLNTLYGLIRLQQYDKALELITGEVKERQDIITFLISSVKDPFIAACLLGKINRSKERKVHLVIDMDSNLTGIPADMDTRHVVTVLGNLIDNAMDAAREKNGDGAVVQVSFTDLGPDLIFDIDDNGPGVPQGMESAIFRDGFTTKQGENRGLGLHIVQNALNVLNGSLQISRSELGGARFTVMIPKIAAERRSIS